MSSTVTYRTLCRRCVRYALIGQAYRRWYRVARAVVRRLADHGYEGYRTVQDGRNGQLCDLVAITSPRTSVKRNLQLAWDEGRGRPRPPDMIRSTRVALDHYYETGEIRGAKTSRFAHVLHGHNDVVVVDTWMARALSVPDRQARNKATQELAERVLWHVWGRMVGRTPSWSDCDLCDVQAAVWAGMIRTHYKDGKIPLYRTEDVGLYRGTDGRNGLSDVPF